MGARTEWLESFRDAPKDDLGIYNDIVRPLFEPFAVDLVDRVAPAPGATGLDVACGPGTVTRHLARAIGPSGAVIGSDISPAMLAIAASEPSEPGAAPIEWLQSPAHPLAMADASVDVMTCQQGLQFFPDKRAALAESRRVITAHGSATFAFWVSIDRIPFFGALHDAIRDQLGEDLADRYAAGPWSLPGPEAAALAREAGFGDVDLSEVVLESPLPANTPAALVLSLRATGIAAEAKELDDAERGRLLDAVARRLDDALGAGARTAPFTTSFMVCRP
jgi:SAM-dependent methyltransferase